MPRLNTPFIALFLLFLVTLTFAFPTTTPAISLSSEKHGDVADMRFSKSGLATSPGLSRTVPGMINSVHIISPKEYIL